MPSSKSFDVKAIVAVDFKLLKIVCWALATILIFAHAVNGDTVDFVRDVRPIFEAHCFNCHGPDQSESGLRLDQRSSMLTGGDSGLPAIVPGDSKKSYLMEVVNHVDEEMAMPPDEDKIPAKAIEALAKWIDSGAVVPGQMQQVEKKKSDLWSLQPLTRPIVPQRELNADSDSLASSSNPVDAFLLRSLDERGWTYSDPADPRTLIRRASIVLTGLPPTWEQTQAFLNDYSIDATDAYSRLVDRLIDSPHFGERWAQHWLDVIRWAETNGSESNAFRKNAWVYRDYVIQAFNEDKPYDQFLFDQLAGDTNGQGAATGYLVAGPHVPIATVGREPIARRQARADRIDEVLQTVGATAMGVTIGCARCHNHKFDPISITDYYSLSAVFQDVEYGSRYPDISQEHPRQVRGRKLLNQIQNLRDKVSNTGPWIEHWNGYVEIHVPQQNVRSVKFKFAPGTVRIDELEIFGQGDNENFAALSDTEVKESKDASVESMPLHNINDGKYGNESWIARTKKDSDQNAWVQFDFSQNKSIDYIRISSNRLDAVETDYLLKQDKMMFKIDQIEVRSEVDGEWKQLLGAEGFDESSEQNEGRAKILNQIASLIAERIERGPRASFVGKFVEPVKTFVLSRGSPESPRDEVFPAGLSELGGELGIEPNASGPERRVAFAKWVTSPRNPLTARVAANRIWHHVFGHGIVATTSDFGAAGANPTHPELLDWLAMELTEPSVAPVDAAWGMKRLIRMLVTSDAFKQSSRPVSAYLKQDGNSSLLWRFPPKRVEAEVIRDSVLQASGVLDRSIGGKSYRIHNVKKRYAQWEVTDNSGEQTWRRMIYQERMRRVDDQMFTAFDFPDCGQVRAKRPVSTTPLQALNLMNSNFVIDQSTRIATRAAEDAGENESRRVGRCFQLLMGRLPDAQELKACVEVARNNDLSIVCRALINSNEFAFLP